MEIAPSEGRMMRIPGNEGELVSKQRMTIAPLPQPCAAMDGRSGVQTMTPRRRGSSSRMASESSLDLDPRHELEQLRRERDLYLRLLELGARIEIKSFLTDSLALVVELTGARNGYLELRDPNDGDEHALWYLSHGFSASETADVRSRISSGILAEVLATGQTVDIPSALLDPRFRDRSSVRAMQIETVLCIPIGQDPPLGALYLQGHSRPGPFAEEQRRCAEIFCHHLARLADSLIVRLRAEGAPDPTEPLRKSLRLDGVIGRSPALAALLREVAVVSPLDVSILLTGESGTGKSQIARIVHDNGRRSDHPFVEVNCAALPETLIESELFGAVAGAHSTAMRAISGKVAAAEHGTLFLDEISELTLASQAKLLQVLQSKQYFPLGASGPKTADVRVIAATNSDLEAAVREGRFREDLFYRLQVLPVRVPGLRERREDIPELARHFCEASAARHHLPALDLSLSALHALTNAEWPGHVRQLAHTVEAALIRAVGHGATAIEREHVFPGRVFAQEEAVETSETFQEQTRRFQARLLGETLDETGWNISETSRRLDLARSHVYTLIRAFGLERRGSETSTPHR
jgi:Nif-specific regulatory protein